MVSLVGRVFLLMFIMSLYYLLLACMEEVFVSIFLPMEEIHNIFNYNLKLLYDESNSLVLPSNQQNLSGEDLNLCLLVQVLSSGHFNKRAFMNMINGLWQTSTSILFEELCENGFLYQFLCLKKNERVIQGFPWHFDKSMVLLDKTVYQNVYFWIQVHNVPLSCMTMAIGKLIGDKLGELVHIDS